MALSLLKPVRKWNSRSEKLGLIIDMTVVKVKSAYNVIILQAPESIQGIAYLYESKYRGEAISNMIMQKIPHQAFACTRLSNSRVAFACDRHLVYIRPHPSRLIIWATCDTLKTYTALCSIGQTTMWAKRKTVQCGTIIYIDMIDLDGKILKTLSTEGYSLPRFSFLAYSSASQRLTVSVLGTDCVFISFHKGSEETKRQLEPNKSSYQVSSITVDDKGGIYFVDLSNCCVMYTQAVNSSPKRVLSDDNCAEITSPEFVHVYEDMLFVFNKTDPWSKDDKDDIRNKDESVWRRHVCGDILMFYLKDLQGLK